jgi:phosphoribosylformylglycinamidine synthase
LTEFTCLLGEPALSEFRKNKLVRLLQSRCQLNASIDARFVYFVEASLTLEQAEKARLEDILHARLAQPSDFKQSILVIPRLGTLSPWSSKATDIATRCGIDKVNRIERGTVYRINAQDGDLASDRTDYFDVLHDRMTQSVVTTVEQATSLFKHERPRPLASIPVLELGAEALQKADRELGLALSDDEIDYLVDAFVGMQRNPTDAELMMFAQANSEHCRHKIFNASWTLDGQPQDKSLFDMIRNTHAKSPVGVLSAYHDNSAVLDGDRGERFFVQPDSGKYGWNDEALPFQIKVETHNHPTAISPFAGAATGSGGEIRDEAATGRGARPKAGLTGYTVSHLEIPGYSFPWQTEIGKPDRISSSLDIMLEGPIGGAAFNNEFGRPALCGYFRTFTQKIDGKIWGYHKPIMIAGGFGSIRKDQVDKLSLTPGASIVVLGGPAMLIGLGGGAASSVGSGQSQEELDFASVQRGNPEMQRRCQEVIDACWARGENNPVLSIHDVGAGGLSNALPELLNDGGVGGDLELREVVTADSAMSPMEIWCNESQERYVLALEPAGLKEFEEMCVRERCPFIVIGSATEERRLRLSDSLFNEYSVDMPLDVLLGKTPAMHRTASRKKVESRQADFAGLDLSLATRQVLRFPAVGSKSFLITIGDRSVGGLVTRDQMVGPWQVPVADAAVTLAGFRSQFGEAVAMGERSPLAVVNGPASGRMAVAEAVTNIASAAINHISDIRLAANWMAAAGEEGQDSVLFDTVKAVGMELCPDLGIAIPVGKDSLSLKTQWKENGTDKKVQAPVSLIVTAFAPVADVHRSLTPQLDVSDEETSLLLIDLGQGKNRVGGSVLAQVNGQFGELTPDLDSPQLLCGFFAAIQELNRSGLLLAYHDRSDGGLAACLCEMAFATHCGLQVSLPLRPEEAVNAWFAEELGAVIQVCSKDLPLVRQVLETHAISDLCSEIGQPGSGDRLQLYCGDKLLLDEPLPELQQLWSETSHALQRLRDNPDCADAELSATCDWSGAGMTPALSFDPQAPMISSGARPEVAILREQGVNGQLEMAAAFDQAGFSSVDVHMSDLIEGRYELSQFQGFVACGGFSYGDVLGAGRGWAKSILFANAMRDAFSRFLQRQDRFALGVCNGCQMLSALREIIPGTSSWPDFVSNRSEQFEARLSMVEVSDSPSLFFSGMEGCRIPVATAHGEGRVLYTTKEHKQASLARTVALRYIDSKGQPTEQYPDNPNGSPAGITGLCNEDGRVTILMPHPERTLRTVNFSWAPSDWGPVSPWQRMFHNARQWTG